MSGIYDPEPGKPYGVCETCGNEFADRHEVDAHLHRTSDIGQLLGHRVLLTNQTRLERITSALSGDADDLLTQFVEEVWDQIERGNFTEEEATAAIENLNQSDFREAWEGRDR